MDIATFEKILDQVLSDTRKSLIERYKQMTEDLSLETIYGRMLASLRENPYEIYCPICKSGLLLSREEKSEIYCTFCGISVPYFAMDMIMSSPTERLHIVAERLYEKVKK